MFLSVNISRNFAYSANKSEYLIFDIYEHKFKKTKVPVFLSLPKDAFKQPFPLIISQHGSESKIKFPKGEGKTDEYSFRLLKKGITEGYAVAIIDAFYKKNLKSQDKKKFPLARMYAEEV